MKRALFGLIFIIFRVPFQLDAQISSGGMPPSFDLKVQKLASSPDFILPQIENIDDLLEEDKLHPTPYRYSIVEKINIDIKDKGKLLKDENGNKIWQYHLTSGQAFSLGLIFEKYKLPEKARLFVYSPDRKIVLGAFTHKNNKETGKLHLQELPGNEAVIEYFEPIDADFEGELVLGGVGQAYKNLFDDLPDTAFIGINCPTGDDWQLEKHAVVKLIIEIDGGLGLCTGFLVNNTNQDGTPYLVTANHCVRTIDNANSLIVHFNYEKDDCQGTTTLTPPTISGSNLLATYRDYDFSLVKLSLPPPANYQPYYAGWSIEGEETPNVVGIHHPQGKEKSIAIDYDSIRNIPYQTYNIDGDGNVDAIVPENTKWLVQHDRGVTYNGSSGSPLFDKNKRALGILSTGSSDYSGLTTYIRFDKTWNPVGSDSASQLRYWLDPSGTDPDFLDGYIPFPDETAPDAHFTSNFRRTCPGSEIELQDKTVFGVNSWQWEFSPNSITFVDGNDTSQNPVVKFNEQGEYTVKLTATNKAGSSEHTRNNYISTEGLKVSTRLISLSSNCAFDNMEAKVVATGAKIYHWFVDDFFADFIELQNADTDSVTINLNKEYTPTFATHGYPDSLVAFKVYVEGIIDSCSSIGESEIMLYFHNNDSVEDAFPLAMDTLQGPFINYCATVEENEPIPPVGNCTTQGEWCGCNLGNDYEFILGNSTWFTFVAPTSGVVGIETFGYDNQIAVYDAENAEDILSEDPTKYEIIGASDDFSDTNFSAMIPSLAVIPGKKYWLQADGSACNTTGSFIIRISSEGITNINTNSVTTECIASIYPNPAQDIINIKKESNSDVLDIKIFDVNGKIVGSKRMLNRVLRLDVKNLASGFYIVHIKDELGIQVNKLIIE